MSTSTPNNTTDNDISFRQCAVIEFLVKDDIPTAEIDDFNVHMEMYARVIAVLEDGWKI